MVLFQFQQLSFQVIFKAFIVHGFLFIFFIYMIYKILKRGTSRLNIIFCSFYISITIGFFFNFIFVLLADESMILVFYYLTVFFLMMGPMFLLVFTLLLWKSGKVFTTSKQLIILLISGIVYLCMILIPEGVRINAQTSWNPVYSVPFYLYLTTIFTMVGCIPQIYVSFKTYKALKEDRLRKKWKQFNIGVFLIYLSAYGTYTYHTLNIEILRLIWSFVVLGLFVISAILIYNGVGKFE